MSQAEELGEEGEDPTASSSQDGVGVTGQQAGPGAPQVGDCLLYTSDAADD